MAVLVNPPQPTAQGGQPPQPPPVGPPPNPPPQQPNAPLPPQPPPNHPQPPAYAPTHFQGQLPAPVGEVATAIATATLPTQRQLASDFHDFLRDPTSDLRELNGDDRCFTCLLCLPGTHQLRLLYGFGFGTAGIGQVSPLANKLLALFGEGGALGCPQVVVLDPTIRAVQHLVAPSDEDIEQAFTEGHTLGRPTHRAINVNTTAEAMRLAPIPAYLVYDGFDADLEAALVYERLRTSAHTGDAWHDNALSLCRSSLVGSWRNNDEKPFLDTNPFTVLLPAPARTWAANTFRSKFADLVPAPPGAAPPLQAALNQVAPPGQGQLFQLDVAAIQQLLQAHANGQRNQGHVEEKKDEDPSGLAKVSAREQDRMKGMCGLPDTADEAAFPKWYRDIFEKNHDEKDKIDIVCSQVEASYFYDDAEVPMYPALAKMILKRDWTAGDIGKRAAYVNATKGLSPFAMMDLTEEDVALMREDFEDMAAATTLTAADYKAARSKIKAVVPESAEDFLLMLRRFANLLFALFSSQCPLYKEMHALISGLKTLSPNARSKLTKDTKAAMLWIILLQARRFAQGKMAGEDACLWEFTHLQLCIKQKTCQQITHMELPSELVAAPKKRKDNTVTPDPDKPSKNPRVDDQERPPQNALLKSAFEQPLKDANYPSFNKVCEFCGITKAQLLPSADANDCKQFILTGKCKYRNCKFQHRAATDAEAKEIITKLKRFIDNPLALKGTTP